ncbi:NAD-dependent epimerase/dehydratase family protein [Pseudoduganella namucuonensis]|uniref:Nucleoside-diphosphate-sugar epimerase n=1 Tax=Pseudoduganella namucuonensis TaxID=1035707 RepID=A0A1I7L4F2_9BURK|nr:NAD-dependent epimerase/dehydratase family protein [Pseudoduganella namucuonensis]SFV04632.1 Nucleoside-diphosphate-sugar epimerase [Pseudoduganella namucuonensis]
MHKNILVMGGTRGLGAALVDKLLDAGHTVAVADSGIARDGFGTRARRIVADRADHAAMRAAFAGEVRFDIVYDLLCHNPLDAAIAIEVLAGKVDRYVMASSIEVYRNLMGRHDGPFEELDLDLSSQRVDMGYPWHDALLADYRRADGMRQAEALLYRDATLPVVTVRLAHVLGQASGGDAGDRAAGDPLAHYVALAQTDQALLYANGRATTSFLDAEGASAFLLWAGAQDFLGPVNAASGGQLSALGLHRRVGEVLGLKVRALPLTTQAGLSPFDLPHPLVLNTERAAAMGFRFSRVDGWLDLLIHQHQPDLVAGQAPVRVTVAACTPRRPSSQTSLVGAR